MDAPPPFLLKLLGTKFEITPYHPKDRTELVRYRIVCRHFAPPIATDFIATAQDLRALHAWLHLAFAMDPSQ